LPLVLRNVQMEPSFLIDGILTAPSKNFFNDSTEKTLLQYKTTRWETKTLRISIYKCLQF